MNVFGNRDSFETCLMGNMSQGPFGAIIFFPVGEADTGVIDFFFQNHQQISISSLMLKAVAPGAVAYYMYFINDKTVDIYFI